MQRLFSTFPGGLPGAGLVLLRAAAAIPLVYAGLLTVAAAALAILGPGGCSLDARLFGRKQIQIPHR